ncbi:protein-ER retention protein [Saxophila tyrrhenica]|uniref:Protein-ER retention protein n=1 Tax=Saxophila tyrrhenica TaxID=1690608 RepID=A0AAV9PM62_9PEZI|nr:protein-ER retention protein [Saxophila tyrrhenica]
MEDDPLDISLPLPYRLSILIVGGVWLWGFALQLVKPLAQLVGHPHGQQTHQTTYTFASILTGPLVLSVLFWSAVTNIENAATWRFLPNVTLLLVILKFVPLHIKGLPLPRAGLSRFWSSLKRVSIGGLAKQDEPRFGDVLLADALTSYARPIAALYVAFCMFLPSRHTQKDVSTMPGAFYIIPALAAYPFAIRFRQCLLSRQPANAIKYMTAFPPIIVGAMMSYSDHAIDGSGYIQYWWVFFAVVNSGYSLWWDIFVDWDLWMISSAPHHRNQTRIMGLTTRCVLIVIVDSILRFTWLGKLSARLDIYEYKEKTVFLLEMLEVMRRWMWLLFRAETEWLRKRGENIELSPQLG